MLLIVLAGCERHKYDLVIGGAAAGQLIRSNESRANCYFFYDFKNLTDTSKST
jgi:hypothetical protein